MSVKEKIKGLKDHVHICAIYPIILVIYGGSKVVERIFGIEHIWASFWHKSTENMSSKAFSVIIVTPLWVNLIHWIMVWIFAFITKFKFIKRYKIQSDVKTKLTPAEWTDLTRTVYLNQFVVLPLSFGAFYLLLDENHPLLDFKSVPTFPVLFIKMIVCMAFYEGIFYYFHRILHHKSIYKYIHKKHHKFKTPFVLVGQYQHPIEYVICDIIAPGIGVLITRCDTATSFTFTTLVAVVTVFDHCGYHLPFLLSPETHDYHHANYEECFGSNGLMDFLHGTSKSFIKSGKLKKHNSFFGLGIGGSKGVGKSG